MSATRTINVLEFTGTELLSTRNSANRLMDYIESRNLPSQILDFNGIESVTRSFFDQLSARMSRSQVKVMLVHLSPDVKSMLAIVKS